MQRLTTPREHTRADRTGARIMNAPETADVERIAAIDDPVLRNLSITQCYHELALALRQRFGAGANWCAFATWASKQAGTTIRGEDLARALEARLGGSAELTLLVERIAQLLHGEARAAQHAAVRTAIRRAVDPAAAFERAGAAVAEGNLKVFAEIGREFARFLDAVRPTSGDGLDGAAVARFCAELRAGAPPDGQQLLRDAFLAYADAAAAHGVARAEAAFHANLLVGVHEQTRLQPQIAAALDAGFDGEALKQRLLTALLPGFWLRLRHRAAGLLGRRPPLDDVLDRLVAALRSQVRQLLTAELMTLRFPQGTVLRLGRDLERAFAPSLVRLARPALVELLREVDATPDSVHATGARDWALLAERMHFITDLFRCFHEWEPLFAPPFTPAQVAALRAGRRPAGEL